MTVTSFALPKTGTIVLDFDDVFFPGNNGTHARIKELITANVSQDLGSGSVLAKRDEHGHMPYFPQYVLYKYIQTGRDAENPAFVKAMERCYFGDDIKDPAHYRNITRDDALHAEFSRLRHEGAHFVILTSGPYNPHVKRVLSQLGLEEFFPRQNIYDIGRMAALYDKVTLEDFQNPTDEKLLRWFKPKRENYLAMAVMAGLKPGQNLYFEDNDVNGSHGATDTRLSADSAQALMSKFKLSPTDLSALNVPDQWGWINLEGKALRASSSHPALEATSLAKALQSVTVMPGRSPTLRQDDEGNRSRPTTARPT